ncbi:P-type DNA transfer ATPase VirB11 [Vibrio vulnificus]|uniref:P-type DNA transfer ATPase VirB11 n=1 Tax=Vibrio vulnificus TaxID=672 RepID=UPI004059D2E9
MFAFDHSLVPKEQLLSSGIQQILDLEGITEVAINEPGTIWFDRGNGWEMTVEPRLTFELCMDLAKSLCVYSGIPQTFEEKPLASVTLPDGERGQIAVPPATQKEVVSMTFRKPSSARFTLADYQNSGRFDKVSDMNVEKIKLTPIQRQLVELKDSNDMESFFRLAVRSKQNILIVGGTGSGKTTVMKAMVDEYPDDKRLFTIEDVHELNLPKHKNCLHLFYKQGGVTPKELIESCMRMKPDHVLLAELRGDEAWTYLEMLNTGHEGSITTIHANDCRSAPARLAGLVKQSPIGKTLDYGHIMRTIKTSIDVIVFFRHTQLVEIYYHPEEKNHLLGEV